MFFILLPKILVMNLSDELQRETSLNLLKATVFSSLGTNAKKVELMASMSIPLCAHLQPVGGQPQ